MSDLDLALGSGGLEAKVKRLIATVDRQMGEGTRWGL